MKHATMLYKKGTQLKTELGMFDYCVIDKCDEEKFDAALADGWYESQQEVIDGMIKQPKAPAPVETAKQPETPAPVDTTEPVPPETTESDSKAMDAIKKAQEKLKDK
ncbi:hypothetical protein KAR91_21295 [Candidatus Pacearchaeota archaeon]|nr:hypothetical protein [Candidatus Pacearchaeota archaeon]